MAAVARDVDFSYRVDVSRGVTLAGRSAPSPHHSGDGGAGSAPTARASRRSCGSWPAATRPTTASPPSSTSRAAARGSTAASPTCRPRVPASDSVPVVCATAWRWTRRWRTSRRRRIERETSVASHTGELGQRPRLAERREHRQGRARPVDNGGRRRRDARRARGGDGR